MFPQFPVGLNYMSSNSKGPMPDDKIDVDSTEPATFIHLSMII